MRHTTSGGSPPRGPPVPAAEQNRLFTGRRPPLTSEPPAIRLHFWEKLLRQIRSCMGGPLCTAAPADEERRRAGRAGRIISGKARTIKRCNTLYYTLCHTLYYT
ncbi:Hypothetical protein NTJ_03277 [Nesidiocoris tenuis]|nr:Hypothetical protein NTJ_03277 [Nesidiocoris tenuis]